MKKKTKTTVAEATAESIVANGIEFTPKMIEDLTKIAESEKSAKKEKKKKDPEKLFPIPLSKFNTFYLLVVLAMFGCTFFSRLLSLSFLYNHQKF